METLLETLVERVDKLIDSQKSHRSLLSTTAKIDELAARSEGLERAIREIAREVERLSATREA